MANRAVSDQTTPGVPVELAVDLHDWSPFQKYNEIFNGSYYTASMNPSREENEPARSFTYYLCPTSVTYEFTGDHDNEGLPIYKLVKHSKRHGHGDHR